jgi:hypothetical protein
LLDFWTFLLCRSCSIVARSVPWQSGPLPPYTVYGYSADAGEQGISRWRLLSGGSVRESTGEQRVEAVPTDLHADAKQDEGG